MACWDIIGKDLKKPIYELLGGQVREKLRSYTYLYPKDNDETKTMINKVMFLFFSFILKFTPK